MVKNASINVSSGVLYLKITLHGNLSFVDTVSDSDAYGSFISNFRLFTILNSLRFHNKITFSIELQLLISREFFAYVH